MENIENINNTPDLRIQDEPKITFLEAFHGILFSPKKLFSDLENEDGLTILTYGALSVFLANLGKIAPNQYSLLNIFGTEFLGMLGWFFTGLFILFLSVVFKAPNSNFPRLLGYTGLAHLPFLLLTPISILSRQMETIYNVALFIMFFWTFALFFFALSKSLKLESWRVILLAIIPFCLGVISNITRLVLSGIF